MRYLGLSIDKTGIPPELLEILLAYLSDAGFEGFEDDFMELKAFCKCGKPDSEVHELMENFPQKGDYTLQYSTHEIAETNWNEQWEKNFSPIVVENRILVKAPFHTIPDLEYTVTIEPKMSFGTGHHETTRLMLREMLAFGVEGKEVLDMGCGTGVLAIMAKIMGASYVLAVDIDEWAFQNSYENFQRNQIQQPFDILPGDCNAIEGHSFHVIFANINRNILLQDMPAYKKALKKHGTLILSGILSTDKEVMLEKAKELGFTFISSFYENNWISLNLRK